MILTNLYPEALNLFPLITILLPYLLYETS